MRFLWRVFITALFPVAGHLCLAATLEPWRLDAFQIADFSLRWLTAAAIVHSLSVRAPIFLIGIMVGAAAGLNVGASAMASGGDATALAAPLVVHSALGLMLGAGAWIARMTFPPRQPPRP